MPAATLPPPDATPLAEELGRTLKVSWCVEDGDYTAAQVLAALGGRPAVADVVLRPAKRKRTASALVVMSSLAAAESAAVAPA